MAPLVTLLTSALCIWLAQMAYWLPLKRRENYRLRVLFVGEHFYKIVYPAGRRCQRLLQRLDRAYVGIYL